MAKTLFSIGLWAALGWLCGAWTNATVGWTVFSLGLITMILVSGLQLARISKWARDIDQPPPHSVGPWDDILAPVYRQLRKSRHDIGRLSHNVDSIMLAAEALPDGAVTLNEAMELTWCNQTASEHIGLDPDQDRGHSIFNILRSPEFSHYAKQADWHQPVLLHISNDGDNRSLLVQLTAYGSQQFLLVSRDVTQIEKLETTRKDFVANVSHELRSPLTVLSGFLETLQDLPPESLGDEQRSRYLTLMFEQAQRMKAIVDDLLTLSTLESSPIAQGKPVCMAAVIRSAIEQASILSDNRHTFIQNIADDLYIDGIEAELASAVSNLLTNAVRYTPNEGSITVSWYTTERGHACYSVQDTGIGIASHDIARLTERFYRTDSGRSRATGGTGLGLAITKHVAMRHNADLKIQSRVGVGSVFSVDFPGARIHHGP